MGDFNLKKYLAEGKLLKEFLNEGKDEDSSYNIPFTDNKEDVVDLLLSLNKDKDFNVKRIDKNRFEIIYDGGYNNVYDYKVNLSIIKLTKKIANKFFYWKFALTSEMKDDYIEVDNFGWDVGFMDFFIDDFIKDVGNILASQEN
tara:strand:- start:5007 stop:5438 length:432 start_codon:yes stop_codon:yes gene_type:complete